MLDVLVKSFMMIVNIALGKDELLNSSVDRFCATVLLAAFVTTPILLLVGIGVMYVR